MCLFSACQATSCYVHTHTWQVIESLNVLFLITSMMKTDSHTHTHTHTRTHTHTKHKHTPQWTCNGTDIGLWSCSHIEQSWFHCFCCYCYSQLVELWPVNCMCCVCIFSIVFHSCSAYYRHGQLNKKLLKIFVTCMQAWYVVVCMCNQLLSCWVTLGIYSEKWCK